jgi:hypothetical protein
MTNDKLNDKLMLAARAAGYSMIPPQDASETELETVVVEERSALANAASAYLLKLRSWLPAAPAMPAWLNTRAHA